MLQQLFEVHRQLGEQKPENVMSSRPLETHFAVTSAVQRAPEFLDTWRGTDGFHAAVLALHASALLLPPQKPSECKPMGLLDFIVSVDTATNDQPKIMVHCRLVV